MVLSVAAAVWALNPHAPAGAVEVDPNLPEYTKTDGVGGNLNSVGSDTLNNLMTFWAEEFKRIYPNVKPQIEGKGSSTAPPALIEGTAQLGPMSRMMKKEEIEKFETKYGFQPTAVGVALDCLAVYVNKDNPVRELSCPELDAIFSQTRKGGLANIAEWGQVGAGGNWARKPISLYGRNSASGTYGYFKQHALFKGDFKDTVKEQPGSAAVVQGITQDRAGIGYSGIGYITSGVETLAISRKQGEKAYLPTYENAMAGHYPLARMLYVYVVKEPHQPLPPLVREFLRFVLSRQGQEVVIKDGYLPLPAPVAAQQLEKIME
jgi:phosphate transport system substrate-binding protein